MRLDIEGLAAACCGLKTNVKESALKLLKTLILIHAFSSATALAEDTEILKSPYFIDGIHCEGLSSPLSESQEKNLFEDGEAYEMGIKVFRQGVCETIFDQFGIAKFQWVTPEDLAHLDFVLKRSKRYKSVEIAIKKSELANHIHLVGHFVEYEGHVQVTAQLASSVAPAPNGEGTRQSQRASGTIGFAQRGPANVPPYALSFDLQNSTASRALTEEKPESKVKLSDNESIAQQKSSASFSRVNLRLAPMASARYSSYFDLGMSASHLAGDERKSVDSRYGMGWYLNSDPLINAGRMGLHVVYGTYQVLPWDTVVARGEDEEEPRIRSMTFAGISQTFATKSVDMSLAFHRSLTKDLHYYSNSSILFKFQPEVAGLSLFRHGIGVDLEQIRGAVLPEHRFGLPNREEGRAFYRVSRDVSFFDLGNVASLDLGIHSYASERAAAYYRNNFYSTLSLRSKGEDFDLGIALTAESARVY